MPGGERIWRPDYSDVAPDGENPTDVWDSKRLKRLKGLVESYYTHKAKYLAYAAGRHFHMVLNYSESRRPDLVLVEAERYADLCEKEEQLARFLAR